MLDGNFLLDARLDTLDEFGNHLGDIQFRDDYFFLCLVPWSSHEHLLIELDTFDLEEYELLLNR